MYLYELSEVHTMTFYLVCKIKSHCNILNSEICKKPVIISSVPFQTKSYFIKFHILIRIIQVYIRLRILVQPLIFFFKTISLFRGIPQFLKYIFSNSRPLQSGSTFWEQRLSPPNNLSRKIERAKQPYKLFHLCSSLKLRANQLLNSVTRRRPFSFFFDRNWLQTGLGAI